MSSLSLLLVAVAAAVANAGSVVRPSWPGTYSFNATWTMGYEQVEGMPIVIPISVSVLGSSVDAPIRQRISSFENTQTVLALLDENYSAELIPVLGTPTCFGARVDASNITFVPFLFGDLEYWVHEGVERKQGVLCDKWSFSWANSSCCFNRTATNYYEYFTWPVNGGANARPVYLEMRGTNNLKGSHVDVYKLTFNTWTPNVAPSEDTWAVPASCSSATGGGGPTRMRAGMRATLPPRKDYAERARVVAANARLVDEHNARPARPYTLALHPLFALHSDAEFAQTRLMRKGIRPHDNRATRTHPTPSVEAVAALPRDVDWRVKRVVPRVPDQLWCGSCWTFGSIGALEAQYALASGGALFPTLSEQQLVDCAIGYAGDGFDGFQANMGCDGGFASMAYQYYISTGRQPIPYAQYPYQGIDGACRDALYIPVGDYVVSGYVNVTSLPALLDALATVGPIAVAINAVTPGFRYYSDGVFQSDGCKTATIDDLDHEVLAVGYHLDEDDAKSYVIIENSWSTYSDNKGFANLGIASNACGAGLQATYPLLTPVSSSSK